MNNIDEFKKYPILYNDLKELSKDFNIRLSSKSKFRWTNEVRTFNFIIKHNNKKCHIKFRPAVKNTVPNYWNSNVEHYEYVEFWYKNSNTNSWYKDSYLEHYCGVSNQHSSNPESNPLCIKKICKFLNSKDDKYSSELPTRGFDNNQYHIENRKHYQKGRVTINLNIRSVVVKCVVAIDKNWKVTEEAVTNPDKEAWYKLDCYNCDNKHFNIITDGEKWVPIRKNNRIIPKAKTEEEGIAESMSQIDKKTINLAIENFWDRQNEKSSN